jgi:hypothetical protein
MTSLTVAGFWTVGMAGCFRAESLVRIAFPTDSLPAAARLVNLPTASGLHL